MKLNKSQLNKINKAADVLFSMIKESDDFKETELLINANDGLRKIILNHVLSKENGNNRS